MSPVLSLPVRRWQGPHAEVSTVTSLCTITWFCSIFLWHCYLTVLSQALLPMDRGRVYLLLHSVWPPVRGSAKRPHTEAWRALYCHFLARLFLKHEWQQGKACSQEGLGSAPSCRGATSASGRGHSRSEATALTENGVKGSRINCCL